jgi:hypothetical protein
MTQLPYKALLFCGGRFESYSAGTQPSGKVNPIVLRVLRESYKIDASDECVEVGAKTDRC